MFCKTHNFNGNNLRKCKIPFPATSIKIKSLFLCRCTAADPGFARGGPALVRPKKRVIWASEYNLGPQIWGAGGRAPSPPDPLLMHVKVRYVYRKVRSSHYYQIDGQSPHVSNYRVVVDVMLGYYVVQLPSVSSLTATLPFAAKLLNYTSSFRCHCRCELHIYSCCVLMGQIRRMDFHSEVQSRNSFTCICYSSFSSEHKNLLHTITFKLFLYRFMHLFLLFYRVWLF